MTEELVIDVNEEFTEEMAEVIDVNDVRVSDLITLTARLAQVLAEEADLLEEMKISKISDLQKEKQLLTDALESMKKQIHKEPHILDEISEQEREDLRSVVMIFNEILEENYKRLSMARAVNMQVVQAITDVVNETVKQDVYDRKGTAGKPAAETLSVTLNEKV